MAITFNHNDKLYVSGSNVGIGTSTPDDFLQLNASDSGSVYIKFTNSTTGEDGGVGFRVGITSSEQALLWNYRSTPMRFSTADTERMRITEGGNVGIGTTNPPRKLSVETNDTATYSASVNASEISIARKNSSNTAGQVAAISLNATGWSGQTTGVVVLNAIARQGNFSNADFAIQNRVGGNFVETFRITTYGNVGIGTDTPDDNVNTGAYFKPDGGGRFLTVKDSAGSFIMLESSTTTDDDQIGGIYFNNTNGQADAHVHVAGIDAILHKHATNDALSGGDLRFFTKPSGSGVAGPRMVILQNGKVGIGATSPTLGLHVANGLGALFGPSGSGASTYISASDENTINGGYGLDTDTADLWVNYRGYQNGTSRFRDFRVGNGKTGVIAFFDGSTSNVGIGTTDPSAKLHVVGNGEFYSTIGAADNIRTGIAHYDTTAQAAGVGGQLVLGYKYHDNGAYTEGAIIKMYKLNSTSGDYSSGLKFQVRESGANLSSKMVLDPSGNVGIGTTGPNTFLHVAGQGNRAGGSIYLGNQDDGSTKYGLITSAHYNAATEPKGFSLISGISTATENTVSIGGFVWESNPATDIRFFTHTATTHTTGGSERMRINSSGNVGIGTTAPQTRLALGSTQGSGIDFLYDSSNSYKNQIKNYWNSSADTRMDFNIGRTANVAPVTVMSVGYNGNVGIGTTSPSAPLDVRASSYKVIRLGNDITSHYAFSGSSSHTLTLTCGSYHQAEVIISAYQTNSGGYNNYYVRGIWSNNHTSHHWDILEEVGYLTGSSFTFTNGQNDVTNSGKLLIEHTYSSGSFGGMTVRVTDMNGTHSYTIA